jgi:hypothetical protein
MLSRAEVRARLRSLCTAAGGVTAWSRLYGLQRGNVQNMVIGAIPPAPDVAVVAGYRRVELEIYLERDEPVPPILARFVLPTRRRPGRPKRTSPP